jgi:hypothetical protein
VLQGNNKMNATVDSGGKKDWLQKCCGGCKVGSSSGAVNQVRAITLTRNLKRSRGLVAVRGANFVILPDALPV